MLISGKDLHVCRNSSSPIFSTKLCSVSLQFCKFSYLFPFSLENSSLLANNLTDLFLFSSSFSFLQRYEGYVRALASQNQTKKLRKRQKMQKMEQGLLQGERILDEKEESVEEDNTSSPETDDFQPSVAAASRNAVLKACTVTSVSIGALGVLIRQVHFIRSVSKIFQLL